MRFELLVGLLAGKASRPSSAVNSDFTPSTLPADQQRELVVERESQLMNCAVKFILTVDGIEIGRIGNGETLRTNIRENASIMLVCAGMGMKNTAQLFRVRAGDTPRIHFATIYGGSFNAVLTGMQVLETLKGKAAYR